MKTFDRLKEPKNFIGTRKPLFDRLVNNTPHEAIEDVSTNYLDRDGLSESIAVEVQRLLNTRISEKKDFYQDGDDVDETIISYGLPSIFGMTDFNSFDATNSQEWSEIEAMCASVITHFEPRIKNVRVNISKFDGTQQKLFLNITSDLALNYIQGEVSFPISIDCSDRDKYEESAA